MAGSGTSIGSLKKSWTPSPSMKPTVASNRPTRPPIVPWNSASTRISSSGSTTSVAAQDRLVARGNDRLRQLGREEPQLRGDRGGDESRLADEATAGQILISQRLHAEVEDAIDVESAGRFTLKGFRRPVTAFNVVAVRDEAMTAAAPGPSFRFPIE
ncbi:MAG: hypothetical protein E6G31_06685 [Actinobacteria bacterium]|nr:MAG: hypothetical protein E6G31_06685 [Actinomycetota bacterium]